MSAALKISSLVRGWAAAAAPSQGARALSTVVSVPSAASPSFEPFSSAASAEALHGAAFAAPSSSTTAFLRKPSPSRGAPSAHASGFHTTPAVGGSFSSPAGGSFTSPATGAALHPHPLHLVPASPPQGAAAGAGAGGWQSWAAPGGRGSAHPGRRFFASPTLRSGAAAAPPARSTPLLSVATPADAAHDDFDDEPRLCVP